MKTLQPLIRHLGKNEIRLLRSYIAAKCMDSPNDKRLSLLECILKSKNNDHNTIALLAGYKSAQDKAFVALKLRLKEDVLDMLLLQEGGQAFETAFAQAAFDCRKMLIQGELLQARGIYGAASDLLEKALHLAKRYELHAEFLSIADVLRNHAAVTGDLETFGGLNELMDDVQAKHNRVLRAKQMHYEIVLPGLMNAETIRGYKIKGNGLLSKLENHGKRESSSRIAFYHHLSALNFYSNLHEFPDALRYGQKLLKQVTDDPLMRSDANQAGVNMELAGVCLNTGDYEQAVKHAGAAVELFKPDMVNHMQALIILFFAHFRNGDADSAQRVIAKAYGHKQALAEPLLAARLHLMEAALLYSKKQLRDCARKLRLAQPLVKNGDIWFPGVFLIQSLNDLDMESYSVISARLSAFRKQAAKSGIAGNRSHTRLNSIVQFMSSVTKFKDIKHTLRKEKQEISLLRQASGDYYWNPAGYELIRFDDWIQSKAS